jgi:hypothetical protein
MSTGCFGSSGVTRASRDVDVFLGLAAKRQDYNGTLLDLLHGTSPRLLLLRQTSCRRRCPLLHLETLEALFGYF